MPPMRITTAFLTTHHACPEQVRLFTSLYPRGVTVTAPRLLKAASQGLMIQWLELIVPHRAAYETQLAQLRGAYLQQLAPLWAAYDTQRAQLRSRPHEPLAPIRAAYERQLIPIRAAYETRRARLLAESLHA